MRAANQSRTPSMKWNASSSDCEVGLTHCAKARWMAPQLGTYRRLSEATVLQGRVEELRQRWQREREVIAHLQRTMKALAEQRSVLAATEARGEGAKAAEIRMAR